MQPWLWGGGEGSFWGWGAGGGALSGSFGLFLVGTAGQTQSFQFPTDSISYGPTLPDDTYTTGASNSTDALFASYNTGATESLKFATAAVASGPQMYNGGTTAVSMNSSTTGYFFFDLYTGTNMPTYTYSFSSGTATSITSPGTFTDYQLASVSGPSKGAFLQYANNTTTGTYRSIYVYEYSYSSGLIANGPTSSETFPYYVNVTGNDTDFYIVQTDPFYTSVGGQQSSTVKFNWSSAALSTSTTFMGPVQAVSAGNSTAGVFLGSGSYDYKFTYASASFVTTAGLSAAGHGNAGISNGISGVNA